MIMGIDAPARFGSSTLLSMSVESKNSFPKIQTPETKQNSNMFFAFLIFSHLAIPADSPAKEIHFFIRTKNQDKGKTISP